MSKRLCKQYTPGFKLKVVLEVLKEEETVNQLSPLSPLLSKLILYLMDKELEIRGHKYYLLTSQITNNCLNATTR